LNPKKIESIGVRNFPQAHFHIWREWNKTQFQNMAVEFDATQEADLLIPFERILVADNTRPDMQDGQVESENGLEVRCSQDVVFEVGKTYVAFLQLTDGTTENIPVVEGSDSKSMILERAPRLPLAVDSDLYAKTTYIVSANTDRKQFAFLVGEKSPKDDMTSTIRAGNYDARFYQHDSDLRNGLISE
jgi:hypothetical protein